MALLGWGMCRRSVPVFDHGLNGIFFLRVDFLRPLRSMLIIHLMPTLYLVVYP